VELLDVDSTYGQFKKKMKCDILINLKTNKFIFNELYLLPFRQYLEIAAIICSTGSLKSADILVRFGCSRRLTSFIYSDVVLT